MGLQLVNKEEITAFWQKVKLNFVRYSSTTYTDFLKGDLLYIAANGTSQSADYKVTNLHVQTVNPGNFVLGITSGAPAWKTISSALTWGQGNLSTAPTITPFVLGIAGTAVTLPFATADKNGVVSFGEQTFGGAKTFNSSVISKASFQLWSELTPYNGYTPYQDVTLQRISFPIAANQARYGFSLYSWEAAPDSEHPSRTGVGYAPLCFGVSGAAANSGQLFFTGNNGYTGVTNSNYWGINTYDPQYQFHVNGTFGVSGISTFHNVINIDNYKYIRFKDNPSSGTAAYIPTLGIDNYNNLTLGWDTAKKGYPTLLAGNVIYLYYGTTPTLGTTLKSDGVLENKKSIQSTGGGVAAMGIADLTTGGGGSGTVKSIRLGSNTPIPADVDGLVTLPAYTTTEADGYFASSLSITTNDGLKLYNKSGSVLSTVSVASIRSAIGVGTPETAGGVPILDTNAKIKLANIPDVILGQVLYGGTVNASGVATLSTNVKTKLGITSNTVTLSNSAGTSSSYGWVRFEGVYFIMSADSSFASLGLKVGEWLISTGTAWQKIDNTDAVTGIKINNGTLLTGEVNIPAAAADTTGVVTTGSQTFAGGKTFTGNIIKSNDTQIGWNKASSGTLGNMLYVNASNQFIIGYSNATGEKTAIYGKTIELYANNTKVLGLASTGASVTGTLGVSGATSLSDTLSVSGATTINNTLSVTNTLTLGKLVSTTDPQTQVTTYTVTSGRLRMYAQQDNRTPPESISVMRFADTAKQLLIGHDTGLAGFSTVIAGDYISLMYWDANKEGNDKRVAGFRLNNDGNVGIGTSSPSSKLHVVGTANITGNTTFGGTLTVSGATTLSSTLFVTNAATLSSTLSVSGATTLSSTLSVTSTSTLTGSVTLGNNLNLNNDKYIFAKTKDGTNNAILGINKSTTSPSTVGTLLVGYGDMSEGGTVNYPTRIYGTNVYLHYGANRTFGAMLDSSGNVGIGKAPDYKLHVGGSAAVEGTLYIGKKATPTTIYMWTKDDSNSAAAQKVMRFSAGESNLLIFGESTHALNYTTDIHGYRLNFYYGTYPSNNTDYGKLGMTLDENGVLTNIKSIQSTGGGVAAMGIADLTTGGSGGGSGTVKTIQVNSATAIGPDTDGKVSLSMSLTGSTTNAISLTLGGATVNMTASALRGYLNIGQTSDYVTALGTSGNYLTWTKGGVASNITVPYATNAGTLGGTSKAGLFTAFTTASGNSPDTTITIGGTTITRKINADLIDGTHLSEFYKHGRAYCGYNTTDGVTKKPWHLVAEATGTLSDTLQLSISFYVASHYRESYGILNVYARHQGGKAADDWNVFALNWTTAVDIIPANFVLTRKVVGDNVTIRLYCNTDYGSSTNWSSYSFRKLEEQVWGAPRTDLWTMYDSCATNKADGTDNSIGYNYTEIPSDETVQVESTISNIKNKAADSAMLNGQSASYYATAANYLPLTGGTMTLANLDSLTLQRNHATNGAYIKYANNTGTLGCIGFSGVNTPVFRNASNTNYSIWHAGNANLEVTKDAQQHPTSFTLAMGSESVEVGTVGKDYIDSLS